MGKSREILIAIIVLIGLIEGLIESYKYLYSALILILILNEVYKSGLDFNMLFFLTPSLFLIFFDFLIMESTSAGNYLLLLLYIFSLILDPNKIKHSKILDLLIFLLVLINIIFLIIYPNATQYLNNFAEFEYLGYPIFLKYILVNTIGSFVISLWGITTKNIFIRVIVFIFLILSSKTTSLIIFVLALLYVTIRSSFKFLLKLSLFLVVSIVFLTKSNLVSDYLITRLNLFQTNNFSDSLEFIRLKLALNSINTFFDNPLFGIGYLRVSFTEISEILNLPVGHHSAFFDGLARFGLFYLPVIWLELKRWSQPIMTLVLFWMIFNNVISFEWLVVPFILNLNKNESTTPTTRFGFWRN